MNGLDLFSVKKERGWPNQKRPCYLVESTSSAVDFRAKTYQLRDAEKDWEESEADYSLRSFGSLAKYDPDSSSWRTSQRLLFEDQSELLESFAAYGMTVDGAFYPLRTWARRTKENDGGSWPTPTVNMVSGGPNHESPTVLNGRHGLNLKGAVMRTWPTPTLADSKNVGKNGSHQDNLHKHFDGRLNPLFVEWLMGYSPSEWTALEDWAMQWFRPKQEKRSKD